MLRLISGADLTLAPVNRIFVQVSVEGVSENFAEPHRGARWRVHLGCVVCFDDLDVDLVTQARSLPAAPA